MRNGPVMRDPYRPRRHTERGGDLGPGQSHQPQLEEARLTGGINVSNARTL